MRMLKLNCIIRPINPLKPWKMMGRMHDKYLIADGKRYILGGRNTYNYFLGDFPGHKNYDRDVLVVCDEPEKENSVNQLSSILKPYGIRKTVVIFITIKNWQIENL